MDILIDFGVPVIAAFLAYLAATQKHKVKLQETKLTLEKEIKSIEKNHEYKMRELEKELELQQKSKENDIVLGFAKEVMGSAIRNPNELQKLKKLSKEVNRLKKSDAK